MTGGESGKASCSAPGLEDLEGLSEEQEEPSLPRCQCSDRSLEERTLLMFRGISRCQGKKA